MYMYTIYIHYTWAFSVALRAAPGPAASKKATAASRLRLYVCMYVCMYLCMHACMVMYGNVW